MTDHDKLREAIDIAEKYGHPSIYITPEQIRLLGVVAKETLPKTSAGVRSIPDIKADIMAKENELRALYGELDVALEAKRLGIIQRHDAGESNAAIGRWAGLPPYTIRNILWRAGRTMKGRDALRAHRASLS